MNHYYKSVKRIDEQFNNLYYGLAYWEATIAIMRFHALRLEAEVRFEPVKDAEKAQLIMSLQYIVQNMIDDIPEDAIKNCLTIERYVAAARNAIVKSRVALYKFLWNEDDAEMDDMDDMEDMEDYE